MNPISLIESPHRFFVSKIDKNLNNLCSIFVRTSTLQEKWYPAIQNMKIISFFLSCSLGGHSGPHGLRSNIWSIFPSHISSGGPMGAGKIWRNILLTHWIGFFISISSFIKGSIAFFIGSNSLSALKKRKTKHWNWTVLTIILLLGALFTTSPSPGLSTTGTNHNTSYGTEISKVRNAYMLLGAEKYLSKAIVIYDLCIYLEMLQC